MKKRTYIIGDIATRLAGHSSPQPNGCIQWNGSLNNKGYGQIRIQKKLVSTHRAAFEVVNGPLAEDQQVLHRCDNPRCINPEHLFLGTPASNSADKVSKWRDARGFRLPHTKLSDGDVQTIRSAPGTQKQIAEAYGVTQSQVSRIKSGRRRARLDIDRERSATSNGEAA